MLPAYFGEYLLHTTSSCEWHLGNPVDCHGLSVKQIIIEAGPDISGNTFESVTSRTSFHVPKSSAQSTRTSILSEASLLCDLLHGPCGPMHIVVPSKDSPAGEADQHDYVHLLQVLTDTRCPLDICTSGPVWASKSWSSDSQYFDETSRDHAHSRLPSQLRSHPSCSSSCLRRPPPQSGVRKYVLLCVKYGPHRASSMLGPVTKTSCSFRFAIHPGPQEQLSRAPGRVDQSYDFVRSRDTELTSLKDPEVPRHRDNFFFGDRILGINLCVSGHFLVSPVSDPSANAPSSSTLKPP